MKIFENVKATNWKQDNALNSIFRERNRDYIHNNSYQIYSDKINTIIKNIIKPNPFSSNYFYFKNLIDLGDVLVYKNAKLVAIESQYDHITFHIKFEIENPLIEEIERLKKIDESFNDLSDSEFETRKKEWEDNYYSLKNTDVYIADFTYAYIYDINFDLYEKIINLMLKEESIQYAKECISKQETVRKMRFDIENMSYQDKLVYWNLNDEVNDIVHGETPTQSTLEYRKKRSETSEEDYNKANNYMINLINEIDNE